MKATLFNIERRIVVSEDKREGLLTYDIDNLYPQRVENIIANSGVATSVTSIIAKFIKGRGFKDERLRDTVVNRRGLTVAGLLASISEDISRFESFAIHVGYNAMLNPVELTPVPFKNCRLAVPDDQGYINHIAVSDNWGAKGFGSNNKKSVKYAIFNDDPDVVLAQVTLAGSIDAYLGQILYITPQVLAYPRARLDAVLEDCETDSQIKLFKFRNASTQFLASHIIITDKMEDSGEDGEASNEAEEFGETIGKFQGADNASKMLHIQKSHPDEKIEIQKVDIQDVDDLYQYTEESVAESVRRAGLVPRALLSDNVPGSLGNTKAMNEAIVEFNNTTDEEREIVSQIFKKLFRNWFDPVVKDYDFSIEEMQTIKSFDLPEKVLSDLEPNERRELFSFPAKDNKEQATTFLIDRLGVGGTDAMIKVLTDPNLNRDQKIQALIQVFGRSKEQAEALVGPEQTANPNPEP